MTASLIAEMTNEKIDYILWEMPCQQSFYLFSVACMLKTGKRFTTHKTREYNKQMLDYLEDITNE